MASWLLPLLTLIAFLGLGCTQSPPPLQPGRWSAWLESPGGKLPFDLELTVENGTWSSALHNGAEKIPIPVTLVNEGRLDLSMPHYESEISAQLTRSGELQGAWHKRRGNDEWTRMEFGATPPTHSEDHPPANSAPAPSPSPYGRWDVQFSSSDDLAVGQFQEAAPGVEPRLQGTFMTTTGDYRYLAGSLQQDELILSCFDGAHAFLFKARFSDANTITGDFWSRDVWHEAWTAKRNDNARLPDPFEQTEWVDTVRLADLSFPDLDGIETSLDDPKFHGKARILQLFGSWCPNCHDAALYLSELHERYSEQGLSIVGLAFEVTDDFERNARVVREYIKRHRTQYPVLIAGPAEKSEATEAFAALDRVRSYPTTIFLDAKGNIRAIHTGFTGPATGQEYTQLRQQFESRIEALLKEE